MSVTITDRDKGLAALLRRLGRRARVTVGVHSSEGGQERNDSNVRVIDVAAVHEFGSSTHDARPFVSTFVDGEQEGIAEHMREAAQNIIRGEEPEVALDRMGNAFAFRMADLMPEGETKNAITHRVKGAK